MTRGQIEVFIHIGEKKYGNVYCVNTKCREVHQLQALHKELYHSMTHHIYIYIYIYIYIWAGNANTLSHTPEMYQPQITCNFCSVLFSQFYLKLMPLISFPSCISSTAYV
jgi:hypothetical protein